MYFTRGRARLLESLNGTGFWADAVDPDVCAARSEGAFPAPVSPCGLYWAEGKGQGRQASVSGARATKGQPLPLPAHTQTLLLGPPSGVFSQWPRLCKYLVPLPALRKKSPLDSKDQLREPDLAS